MTRLVRFHFTNWDTPYSRLITWWRKTELYSHVHIEISADLHYEVAAGTKAHWFPASNFNHKETTAHRTFSLYVPEEVWWNMVHFLNKVEGKGYDWWGVVGIALGWRSFLRAPTKWYCSSLCSAAYNASVGKHFTAFEIPLKVTPTEFYNYLHLNHRLLK